MTTAAVGRLSVGVGRYASGRVFRLLSISLAVASVVLLLLNVPIVLEQAPVLTWPWSIAAMGAVLVPPLIMILWRRATTRALHMLWGTQAVAILLAYVTVPLALQGARIPESIGIPWLTELATVAGCAAAVAWPVRFIVAYGVTLHASVFALALLVDEPIPGKALGDAAREIFFVTFFMCLAYATRKAGTTLDRTIDSAILEASAAATADARRITRQQLEMLVHDSVIVALLAYSNTGASHSTAAEAQRAIGAIELASSGEPARLDLSPELFAWEVQGVITSIDPDAEYYYEVSGQEVVPPNVSGALIEAASEALRNSIRHAPLDRAVARQVRVVVGDGVVEIVVLDDGQGFDPSAVKPARLGIRTGIIGRMNAIEGGSATVSSRVGYGTTVVLRWHA